MALARVGEGKFAVIGSHPKYTVGGASSDMNYFSIRDEIWADMDEAEQKRANALFIETCAKKKNTFLTTTRKGQIKEGTALAREVTHLQALGYTWKDDWTLVPPKGS